MKKNIYKEVEELLKINEDTVKRVKLQELRIKELTGEVEDKCRKLKMMETVVKKVEVVND